MSARQTVIDLCPACTVVGGKKDASISSRKEICATDGKGLNFSIGQTRINRSPACTVVAGKENPAGICPGKEVRAADAERIHICQTGSCCTPVCAAIGGKKDAAAGPGKEIRAADCKRVDIVISDRQGRSPTCAIVGGAKSAIAGPRKEICAADGKRNDSSVQRQSRIDRCPTRTVIGR